MPEPALLRETYSVLVAGSMNPMIHHPQWYRSIGAIDEEELESALRGDFVATTPFASRFQFGSPPFTVMCQPNQWAIQANFIESWTRMVRVAAQVFAKGNSPAMAAYGLVCARHVDTDVDVKAILAESVAELAIGLPTSEDANTNMTVAYAAKGHTVNASIQNSVIGEKTMYLSYHYDYPSLSIDSISDGRADEFMRDCDAFRDRAVSGLGARASMRKTK